MYPKLVIQLARFGDLVQTKRLLLSLDNEPATKVYLCVDTSLVTLAQILYPFATVIGINAHYTATDMASITTALSKTCADLQAIAFTQVFTLNSTPLSHALARLFPEGTVIGYSADNGQNARSTLCQLASRWTKNRVTAPLNLVDFWGYFADVPIPPEQVNPVPRHTSHNRIGIALAGREQRRSLPASVLAKCIHALFIARNGPTVVCIGTQQEQKTVKELASLLPPAVFKHIENTTGKTSLVDLPELISSLDCLVTPDTGVMHLAAHLGVPVQAFFLSSAWCFETGPYGFGHKIWQASTACAPCLESAPCHHAMLCLEAFSHKDFLAHLSGKYTPSWPAHLTGYISMLDPLGVTYRPIDGPDNFANQRLQLRSLLEQHLLHSSAGIPQPAIAHDFFYERDWILPNNKEIS